MRHRLIHRTRIPGTLIALVLVFAVIAVPMHSALASPAGDLTPVTNADGRVGLCDILPGSPVADSGPTWAQLAYSAGARTNRWEFRMDKLEAAPGAWDFSATDAVVQNDTAHGLDTEGILIGTPRWAVRPGQNPGNGLPSGLGLPITDPSNVWADFVRQTVRHYAGQVGYWEIWNEPDLKYFWTSSAADYYALLKVSYSVIKSIDPAAKVVLAGMVVPDLNFFSAMLDAAGSDPSSHAVHGYFDIAAWHAYGAADSVYPNLIHLQTVLNEHGYGSAPVWVTEAGFPASNPNGEDRQAAFVLQSIAYAFAAGADRVLVYRASDDATPKTWGILSADGIPRPAYTAFAVAAQYLSHVQAASYDPTPETERFVFYSPRNRITLLWNRRITDRAVTLSAGHVKATRVDWQGNSFPLWSSAGQFHVTPAGASYNRGPDPTGSVVGGPPLLLVEDNTRPADLGAPAYIPPMAGAQRQLVVLNEGSSTATVEVSVPGNGWERQELQLPPHAVQVVDLDLLGGASYTGLFRVRSNATITAQALSGLVPVPGVAPAGSWTVSAAPAGLLISNPSANIVTGHIIAYGYGGKVRARQGLVVGPLATVRWSPPAGLHNRAVSLSIQTAGKVMVSGLSGPLTNAVAQPRSTWYTVAPVPSRLVMFNPDGSVPARVDVRYVGPGVVQSKRLKLGGHRSVTLPTRRARTVVISASHGITLGYPDPAKARSPITAEPATRTALTVGGTTTGVSIYNPSSHWTQVRFSVVGRAGGYTTMRRVAPTGVFALQVRKFDDPPRGVLINSSLPIVSTPSS